MDSIVALYTDEKTIVEASLPIVHWLTLTALPRHN